MEMNGGIRNSAIMGAKKRIAMMKNGTNEAGSAANDDLSKCNEWTQTGYKSTVVGMTLYALVVLAFWIIQFLLFALTVEYCEFLLFLVFRSPEIHHAGWALIHQKLMGRFDFSSFPRTTYSLGYIPDVQQEAITWSIFGSQQFFDEVQVLMAFEIVWMVGFVWSFFIMAPGSIHAMFLRSECSSTTSPRRIIDIPCILNLCGDMSSLFALFVTQDVSPEMRAMLLLPCR